MTDRPLTLMAVHAHPDDEATGTGGILARYAAEGIRTVLVTCTDGGCGDGPGGTKPGDPGHDPAAVAAMRREELRASCDALKISDLEMLDYADSGMVGWAGNDAPGSFWQTPVEEGAARLAELMLRYRPDVVVTYDENGFYGHPDHIQAHRVSVRGMELAAEKGHTVSKFYWTTVARRELAAAFETFKNSTENPFGDVQRPEDLPFGALDEEITARVEVGPYVMHKHAALKAHATQIPGDDWMFTLAARLGEDGTMGEYYILAQGERGPGEGWETDLFAGV